MPAPLAADALDQLFRTARTHQRFGGSVSDADLQRLFELMKWGPTAANGCPARFVFIRSQEAKEKLRPCLAPNNVDKTLAAPVTVLVGYDLEFYEHLPRLYPATDARSWFAGNDAAIRHTAFLNGALQGAYLILAARALGLDCGPMSGFDPAKADAAFFAGTQVKSFLLVNLGQGDPAKLYPRGPRFAFEEVCRIA